MNMHSGFEAPVIGFTVSDDAEVVSLGDGKVALVHMKYEPDEVKRRIAKHVRLFSVAEDLLRDMLPDEIGIEGLEKYYVGIKCNSDSIEDVFEGMIHSAQNYQRMPNVIKFNRKDVREKVKQILFGYNLFRITEEYDVDSLYQLFRKEFNVTSEDTKMNSWRKWSHSIIDCANFLKDFEDINAFKGFVNQFDYNVKTRLALPLLLSTRISGMGFALMCDFLKELGYTNYPKPDVHMIRIFYELGLSNNDSIDTFEAMVQMADDCSRYKRDITPFKLDKVLWLICSGNFYLDNIKVEGRRDELINRLMQI